jgi:hypothetical protein
MADVDPIYRSPFYELIISLLPITKDNGELRTIIKPLQLRVVLSSSMIKTVVDDALLDSLSKSKSK